MHLCHCIFTKSSTALPLFSSRALLMMIVALFYIFLWLPFGPFNSVAFTAVFPSSATTRHSSTLLQASAPTTLTETTTWDLRILLQSVSTEKGKKVDKLFSAKVQFIEEFGYEPPQGILKQVFGSNSHDANDGNEASFKIVSSRWILSEDPNDRKDGLWVWGLFSEPLYPFMLLQIETDRIALPGGDGTDAIKPLKLYAQIKHKRDKELGVILSGGALNIKEAETFKVDPFGAASVTLFDDLQIGNLQIKATTNA